jgi:hypothetical protein
MDVVVLPDGTIKVVTGDMGGPAHKAADDFLKLMVELMGGEVKEEKVREGHHEHHDHDHDHEQHKH